MNIAELEERINEINMIDKAFECITENDAEAGLLVELDDTFGRLRAFYERRLEEANMVKVDQGQAYIDHISERV